MKTFKQFLLETMDKPYPYRIIQKNDNHFAAVFQTSGSQFAYHVNANKVNNELGLWNLHFDSIIEQDPSEKFRILATLISFFSEFEKLYKPPQIHIIPFDELRFRLFKKMLLKSKEIRKYKVGEVDTGMGGIGSSGKFPKKYFKLVRK